MNVGIITQPLCGNYGGILQNFALQTVLRSLGATPITLDLQTHLNTSYWNYFKGIVAYLIYKFIFKKKVRLLPYNQVRSAVIDDFVRKNIAVSETIHRYTADLIDKYELHCLIVGSDQVWRPRFNVYPLSMFLDFAQGYDIKKIAYAASFGVNIWEFSNELSDKCKSLIACFDNVSVREVSGIALCKEHWNVDAVKVLDPTLLLDKSVYDDISKDVPRSTEKYIAVYALNISEKAEEKIIEFANKKGLSIKFFTSDAGLTLSIPEWIASIRDASFVITDSFHGTAFSIIYNKEFYSILNKSRGLTRFETILSDFSLKERLIDSDDVIFPESDNSILWEEVNFKRELLKERSKSFLLGALSLGK